MIIIIIIIIKTMKKIMKITIKNQKMKVLIVVKFFD